LLGKHDRYGRASRQFALYSVMDKMLWQPPDAAIEVSQAFYASAAPRATAT